MADLRNIKTDEEFRIAVWENAHAFTLVYMRGRGTRITHEIETGDKEEFRRRAEEFMDANPGIDCMLVYGLAQSTSDVISIILRRGSALPKPYKDQVYWVVGSEEPWELPAPKVRGKRKSA